MPRYNRGVGRGESAWDKARSRTAKRKAAQQAGLAAKRVGKGKQTVQRTSSGAVRNAEKRIKDYMDLHGCSANEAKRKLGLKHKGRGKGRRKGKSGFAT